MLLRLQILWHVCSSTFSLLNLWDYILVQSLLWSLLISSVAQNGEEWIARLSSLPFCSQHWVSIRWSMRSSNSWPILSFVGWTNMCYAYCVTPHFINSADLIWFLLSNVWSLHIPIILGARMMYLMDVFHKYRWLVILVDRLKASAVRLAVDLSSHRHHRRIWPS